MRRAGRRAITGRLFGFVQRENDTTMTRALTLTGMLAACGLIALAARPTSAVPAAKDRVFELRTYTAKPGRTEALHTRFRDHTCKLFKKHGMDLVGFWTPEDEKDGKKDKLIYLLAFPSRDAAKASWKAFQDDPEWQRVYKESHKDGVIVDKVESVYMDPTDYSELK